MVRRPRTERRKLAQNQAPACTLDLRPVSSRTTRSDRTEGRGPGGTGRTTATDTGTVGRDSQLRLLGCGALARKSLRAGGEGWYPAGVAARGGSSLADGRAEAGAGSSAAAPAGRRGAARAGPGLHDAGAALHAPGRHEVALLRPAGRGRPAVGRQPVPDHLPHARVQAHRGAHLRRLRGAPQQLGNHASNPRHHLVSRGALESVACGVAGLLRRLEGPAQADCRPLPGGGRPVGQE